MPKLCPNNRPFDDTGMCTCGEGHQDEATLTDDIARLSGEIIRSDSSICPICDLPLDTGDHRACIAPLVSGSSKTAS